MVKIRDVLLKKVFPKLNQIEENATVKILRSSQPEPSNPFDSTSTTQYDEELEVPCLFSQQPEMVTSANNIVVSQAMYFYLKEPDVGTITMKDRFIFNDKRYRPVEIQNLFGLWKVKVVKD